MASAVKLIKMVNQFSLFSIKYADFVICFLFQAIVFCYKLAPSMNLFSPPGQVETLTQQAPKARVLPVDFWMDERIDGEKGSFDIDFQRY